MGPFRSPFPPFPKGIGFRGFCICFGGCLGCIWRVRGMAYVELGERGSNSRCETRAQVRWERQRRCRSMRSGPGIPGRLGGFLCCIAVLLSSAPEGAVSTSVMSRAVASQSLTAALPLRSPSATLSPAGGGLAKGGKQASREEIRQALMDSLVVTVDDRDKLSRLEQGTQEWKEARENRLTASNFGAAAGHNRYKTPRQLVHDMLYGTFEGNDATRWGNTHEQVACDEYMLTRNAERGEDAVKVSHSGLNVHEEMHWLAVSPDGHIKEEGGEGILEIKCPWSRRVYDEIPPYYADQMQGLMGVLDKKWSDFCVWTPEKMCITRVQFDQDYWSNHLLPALTHFYFDLYVPAYVEREVRRAQGDLTVPPMP